MSRQENAAVGYSPVKSKEEMNGDLEMHGIAKGGGLHEPLTAANVGREDANATNTKKRELKVFYKGESVLPRKRTTLEKYLIALSVLLFLACLVFIVVLAMKESAPGECVRFDEGRCQFCEIGLLLLLHSGNWS